MNQKKSDKICSISDFSSHSNLVNESNPDLNDLVKQTKKNLKPDYNQPIFIISPNFKSKHINALTQLLEDYGIPTQFQSATDSLGLQLNKNFFVVVDNKAGIQKLGSQFNLPIFTVVGYPKIGPNKQNIYCQYAEDVLQSYKDFTKNKADKPISKLSDKISLVKVNQSMLKSGSNAFSMLSSQSAGIRLKSISKYDNKTRQNTLTKQSVKGKSNKNNQNKENLASTRSIMKKKQFNPHLYFLQNISSPIYSKLIEKLHQEIKSSNNQSLEKSVFYCNSENQLINQLNTQFDNDNKINDLKNSTEKKLNYLVLSSQMALKMSSRIQSQFYSFRSQIKLITVMLTKQNNFDDEQLQRDMLVIKKSVQSNIFHSVVCTSQECCKVLKSLGFMNKIQKSKKTLTISQSQRSERSLKQQNQQKQACQISFCPEKNQQQKPIKNELKQVSFKHLALGRSMASEESYQNQYKKNKVFSVISPPKSQISSKSSKIKIIKVIKKSPSNLNSQNQETKSKTISEVNSQYCINKNKSIVEKFQNKISSKRSLSSQKSIRSLGKSKVQTNKIKKTLKIQNQEPFIAQCSQVFFSEDENTEDQRIRNQKDRKQMSCTPFSTNQYYFGLQDAKVNEKKVIQSNKTKSNSIMDGLLFIQYNSIIQSVVSNFKQNCPEKIINKNNMKSFYLAVEYSRQLKKIWKNGKNRKFLPLLIDIQGLTQISKYYSNVMYQEDEIEFNSTIKSDIYEQNEQCMQNTGNITMGPNEMKNIPQLLLFFTIVSQKQAESQVFQQFEKLSSRLPRCQIIKCVVPQNISDNQMREKSKSIYQKMMDFFIELGEDHGDKLVQTV